MKKYLLLPILSLICIALSAQDSMNIKLLFNWQDTSLPPSSAYNNTYNEIWGLAQNGREYAVIGSTMGTHFFDVTDPQNSVQVDFVPGAYQGSGVVHRDYHDYLNYLYMVCDEGPSTLQIVDLSYLPDSVHLVYDSNVEIKKSHNIFIDTATARMYSCSNTKGNNNYMALEIFSLADPLAPQSIFALSGVVGHVHDAYVINDTAFLNAGNDGLHIYDFNNIANPVLLGTLTSYPEQGYNHSGWLSEDGQTYIFADETWGMGLKICDASDLSDLEILSIIRSGIAANSIAHNVLIKGNIAYISYYHDGLYMFDFTDRSTPELVGYYDTYLPPDHLSYRGAWGVYPFLPSGNILLSDMQSGLFIFDTAKTVGIFSPEEISNFKVAVFPNPVLDKVAISYEITEPGKVVYEIIDISGKVILHLEGQYERGIYVDNIKFPENAAEGIYFLRISAPAGEFQQKLLKVNNR